MDARELTEAAVKACQPPTRYELAKRLGTDWKTVNAWAKGKREPRGGRVLELMRIAQERSKGRGRAAALAVLLSLLCGSIGAPQDAYANNMTVLHIIRNWALRQVLRLRAFVYDNTRPALAV